MPRSHRRTSPTFGSSAGPLPSATTATRRRIRTSDSTSGTVRKFLAKAKRRIGVEMNFGAQLAGVVREHTGIEMTHFILKYNGRPMSNTELYDALRSVLGGKAEKRTVLTRGA